MNLHPSMPEGEVVGRPCRVHFLWLAIGFTAIALYGSLVPFDYHPLEIREALRRFRQVLDLPIRVESRTDWAANILLFVPIGFCWLAVLAVDRRRVVGKVLGALAVGASCSALSFALEFSQLWFPSRTPSQNDIAAETIGGLAGVVLWLLVGQALTDWVRTFASMRRPKDLLHWLLQFYCLGLLVYSVLPLDLTIRPAELFEKYKTGKIILVPFSDVGRGWSGLYELFCDVIDFVPVGMLATTWLSRSDRPLRPLSGSLLLGTGIVLLIEVAQLFVYSRYTSTSDLISGTLGVLIGIGIARRWYGRVSPDGSLASPANGSRRRLLAWLAAAVVYAFLLVIIFCAPFRVIHDPNEWRIRYEGFWAVPFARLYLGSEFHAVSEVLRKVLFFAPLGSFLTLATYAVPLPPPIRRLALLLCLSLAAGLGTGIELGQVFLADHTPDSTDVLLYATGAALGMVLTGRVLRAGAREATTAARCLESVRDG